MFLSSSANLLSVPEAAENKVCKMKAFKALIEDSARISAGRPAPASEPVKKFATLGTTEFTNASN